MRRHAETTRGFESRGSAILNGALVALTDPPPDPLMDVTGRWRLVLEPAPALVRD
jgi:hypothetical protein